MFGLYNKVKLYKNHLKGNKYYLELVGGSSYRRVKL